MMPRSWARGAALAALAVSLLSVPARAQSPAPPSSADKPVSAGGPSDSPAERRSGVVFGASVGVGALDVSGYPNSATHVGDPRFHESSGPTFGYGERLFLMGALADTFNFGIWFGGMAAQSSSLKLSAQGVGFRAEAFPLYALSPQLRDLGFIAQFGIGGAKADRKDGSLSVDGTQSFLGAGALYELSRDKIIGLNAVTALTLEYQFITSQSIDSHGVILGGRIAFYGGP